MTPPTTTNGWAAAVDHPCRALSYPTRGLPAWATRPRRITKAFAPTVYLAEPDELTPAAIADLDVLCRLGWHVRVRPSECGILITLEAPRRLRCEGTS